MSPPGPPPDALAVVRRRLRAQRLTGEPFAGPEDAVRSLVAVQAQEWAEAAWSLAERSRGGTESGVEDALARGAILRTHVLRPTWHLVLPEDIRWLLRLTRGRIHASSRAQRRRLGLDAATFGRAHGVLAGALGDGSLTRRELAGRLATAGIDADGPRLGHILMHAELEEVIASGPRRGRQQTYALLDLRAPPRPGDERDPVAALAELALRFFRSHGPATAGDFANWSGASLTAARAALARVAEELPGEDRDGTAWYGPAEDGAEAPDPPTALLLPTYDETIVPYRDLRAVLAHPAPGRPALERAVVLDGRTYGSWRRELSVRAVAVWVATYGSLPRGGERALEAAVARFGRSLGRKASLRIEPHPGY